RKGNEGYDVATGEYTDLVKAGIVDPTKVTRSALQNAASIAGLLLTPKQWSRRFLRRKKLLQCLRAAWAAWIIDPKTPKNFGAKPKQQMNHSSRARKGPAVLLFQISFRADSRSPWKYRGANCGGKYH